MSKLLLTFGFVMALSTLGLAAASVAPPDGPAQISVFDGR